MSDVLLQICLCILLLLLMGDRLLAWTSWWRCWPLCWRATWNATQWG